MKATAQETINHVIEFSLPESLSLKERPPVPDDHVAHLFSLVQWGQTTLASDHLLFSEINGNLSETVGGLIRKLNLLFSLSRPGLHEPDESLEKKVLLR